MQPYGLSSVFGNRPRIKGRRLVACGLALGVFALGGCAPKIDNLSPATGSPGNKVLITGSKLTPKGAGAPTVDFNGTSAASIVKGTAVEATVPAGATTGPVHVKVPYVDLMSPGGTATSPYDFTVVSTKFSESEPNDKRSAANKAGLADAITGSVTSTDPADWFCVKSGKAGPWGYGVEITAKPKNLPPGVSLRVDIETFRKDIGAIGNLTTYHDDKDFSLWTTQAPGTDLFINVSTVGSTSASYKADYELFVAHIPIKDAQESDDTLNASTSVTMIQGRGQVNDVNLCNIMKGGVDIGMSDFFAFAGNDAKKITVIVVSPPLDPSDGIQVYLFDNAKGNQGGVVGNNVAFNYTWTLASGQKATGTWYLQVTNAWDHYATAGAGPTDRMPTSCKGPYTLSIVAE